MMMMISGGVVGGIILIIVGELTLVTPTLAYAIPAAVKSPIDHLQIGKQLQLELE